MSDIRTRRWIALARIAAGLVLLYGALPKFSVGFLQGFPSSVSACASGNPFPWLRTLLLDVVLPHQQVFAVMLAVAELLMGVALTLGFLTGLASLAAMIWAALMMLATWHLTAPLPYAPPAALAPGAHSLLLFLLFFVSRAGRTWGVDARVAPGKGWIW
ncbi:MAG: DoxX family membrane protein [Armatimonadota bacterium]